VSPITTPAVRRVPYLAGHSEDDEHEQGGEHNLGEEGAADVDVDVTGGPPAIGAEPGLGPVVQR
jgi:hypothetical protein